MKKNSPLARRSLALVILLLAGSTPLSALAARSRQTPQQQSAPPAQKETTKRGADFGQGKEDTRKPKTTSGVQQPLDTRVGERLEADDTNTTPTDVPVEMLANRREQLTEAEAAPLTYYNNFMASYRLGPEDVISVSVFGQERYSKAGITVPPDGNIAYPLIPEGILVNGKTTRQVQEEITKRLDEYIIDPKVSVSLEKAVSARYGVIGDVAQPGIRLMSRRLSAFEAVAEAGGVLSTGDKKKVFVLRRQADGTLRPIRVDVAAIEKGKAADNVFLVPGDQVVVPGNSFKKVQSVLSLLPIISFARIFTGGIF